MGLEREIIDMAIQSAVRCVPGNSAQLSDAVTSVRVDAAHLDAGRMDAVATFQVLERALSDAPIGASRKSGAYGRFLKRAGIALVCSGVAMLIGTLAGTLGTL
jgi:hypothetical protein